MSGLSDMFSSLFDGGGGGGSGGGSELLDWFREQQAKQEELTAREKEQAKTLTEYRAGELADREGYAGTVNVGDARQTSDATLAEYIAGLDPADEQVAAYNAAIDKESEQQGANWRIITGQQYEAEGAYQSLLDSITNDADLDAIQKQLEKLQGEYSFYDSSAASTAIEKERKRREDIRRAPDVGGTTSEGGG